jgi:hypothetical protein
MALFRRRDVVEILTRSCGWPTAFVRKEWRASSLITAAKLNDREPYAYLNNVLDGRPKWSIG